MIDILELTTVKQMTIDVETNDMFKISIDLEYYTDSGDEVELIAEFVNESIRKKIKKLKEL